MAANINFNVDGLINGFWQLTIDGLPTRKANCDDAV